MTAHARVRRIDVENALARLSRAAVALGLRNRYEIEFAGKGADHDHVLVDYPPNFDHQKAVRLQIGRHFREAMIWVEGMAYALERAKAEQERQETGLRQRRAEFGREARSILLNDPDARSVRRASEEDVATNRFCGEDDAHLKHDYRADDEPGSPMRICPGRKASEVQYGHR